MALKILKEIVEIPQGIEVNIVSNTINVKGPKGELSKYLADPKIKIVKEDSKVVVSSSSTVRKEKRVLGTFAAHINNLITGVSNGYVYKLKICSVHFPMTVNVENDKLVIKNFLGEKIPRIAKILPNIKVNIKGDLINLDGIDKETVGQTAANIESATRIRKRDRRVFQDGIYIVTKANKDLL